MIEKNKINLGLMTHFLSFMLIGLQLTEQQEDISYLIFAYGNPNMRVCYELSNNIPKKEGHVYVDSIELTAANAANAEAVLTKLAGTLDIENPEEFVSGSMEAYNSKRYCKKIEIGMFARIEKLHDLLFDETLALAPFVNEITVCFKQSALLERMLAETSKKHNCSISALKLREVSTLVYYMRNDAGVDYSGIVGKLHFAMQHSDAMMIIEERHYLEDSQLELLKRYLGVLPSFSINTDSDLLSALLEDETEEDSICEEYLGIFRKGKIGCSGTEELFKSLGVTPVILSEKGRIYSYGATMGENRDNMKLLSCCINSSFGDMADKLLDFYGTDIKDAAAVLKNTAKQTDILFAVPEDSKLSSADLRDFLQSDRPVLSANGGIATKSHGKLKFPESCRIAENIYEFLRRLIEESGLAEEQKKILKILLLQTTDAYSIPDNNIIIFRGIFENAVAKARNSGTDIVSRFSQAVLDAFLEAITE